MPPDPPERPDLVERLAAAASAAVRSQGHALTTTDGAVRGVTIELTLTPTGAVQEAIAYVETRVSGPALLSLFPKL